MRAIRRLLSHQSRTPDQGRPVVDGAGSQNTDWRTSHAKRGTLIESTSIPPTFPAAYLMAAPDYVQVAASIVPSLLLHAKNLPSR